MADLGNKAIDTELNKQQLKHVISTSIYQPSTNLDKKLVEFDVTGSLSGVVTINGTPTAKVSVGLFHRSNMRLIGTQITSNTGAYSFLYLDKTDLENYFLVILDPNNASPWNYSLVRNHLTPG